MYGLTVRDSANLKFGQAGVVNITGTSLVTGDFISLQIISDTIFTKLTESDTTGSLTSITDESFTSEFDTPVTLAQKPISGSVVVKTIDGATTYTEGTDYTIDYTNNTITVLSTGTMLDATAYYISYNCSITFPGGITIVGSFTKIQLTSGALRAYQRGG